PPIDVAGMPALERAQHLTIFGEIDVVGNLGRVIDVLDVHGSLRSRWTDAERQTTDWRSLVMSFICRPSSMLCRLLSHSLVIKHRLLAGAVTFQRSFFADGVGPLENPVLPCGQ